MNRRSLLVAALAVACSGTTAPAPTETPSGRIPIRIGWQTTWATQGQLTMALMHTTLLQEAGFEPTFHGFAYGGPLNEGALAGSVDVLFTADQPAVALGSKAASWGIIGRLMANRVGTFVPPDSPIQSPADLAGKTVVVPFGAAAHRATLGAIERAGLDPKTQVTVANLGLQEVVALVGAGADATTQRWGKTDAAAAWDPAFANLEHTGAVRAIDTTTITSVVVMDDRFVAAHPGADARFMGAMHTAYDFVRADPARAATWFVEESDLPFDQAVLARAASVEPNLSAASAADIRVHLTADEVQSIEGAAAFMHEAGLLRTPADVSAILRPGATRPVQPAVALEQVTVKKVP